MTATISTALELYRVLQISTGLDGVDCGWLRPDFGHKMSFDLAQFFVSIREFVNTCDVKYRSYDFMDAGDAVRRFDVIIMSLSVILDNCHVHHHVDVHHHDGHDHDDGPHGQIRSRPNVNVCDGTSISSTASVEISTIPWSGQFRKGQEIV